jgi:hypothetical protein
MYRAAAPSVVHVRRGSARAAVRAQRKREQAEHRARLTMVVHALWASLLTLAVTAAFATGPASAQSTASVDQRFSAWDRDRNDLLTLDEYRAEARADFDAMDDDANGNVTAEEMEEADPQSDGEMSTAQKIALNDTNEDGVLSLEEHENAVDERFGEIDSNEDDNLGRDELKSPWAVATPRTYPR